MGKLRRMNRVGPAILRPCEKKVVRRGATGVSTNGVTANFMFFDRWTFGGLQLTYFYLPKSARMYLLPNLSKIIICAADPLVLTPVVRNQYACMYASMYVYIYIYIYIERERETYIYIYIYMS